MLFNGNEIHALFDRDDDKSDSTSSAFSSDPEFWSQNKQLRKPTELKSKHKKVIFDQLRGYPVQSEFDRKLIRGVFGPQQKQNHHLERRRQQLETTNSHVELNAMQPTRSQI